MAVEWAGRDRAFRGEPSLKPALICPFLTLLTNFATGPDEVHDCDHAKGGPKCAGGPVDHLSCSTRNIELPDLKHSGIGHEPAHESPRPAGVREGEHSSGAKVSEQVLDVARQANT